MSEELALHSEVGVKNMSGVDDRVIMEDPALGKLIRSVASWQDQLRGAMQNNVGTIFDRQAFTPPNTPYDEMKAARTAVATDDICSGVAEITEAYGFQGVKCESTEADEADVFNQWAADVELDELMRKMGREEFSCSQFVVGMRWDWREYTVRTKAVDSTDPNDEGLDDSTDSPGPLKKRARRKKYRLWMPVEFTVLDSLKVVPIDHSPLGKERLAWSATEGEIGWWRSIEDGNVVDLVAQEFYKGVYTPSAEEAKRLIALGVPNPDRLIELNPDNVWRHTLTKPDYEEFADVRLKSIFPLLDMKRQLIMADRAVLIGAANYIVLIRKGDKDMPGTPQEIEALKQNYNFIAKVPVIISDHRLTVDIIAPKVDLTLKEERYTTIDSRILMRLLGTLTLKTERSETNITLSNSVARMMENRRHMIKRTIEKNVFKAIMEHPKNQKAGKSLLKQEPNLAFTPRSISLGFDPNLVSALLALRTQREISRETILEQFGLDEATEAMRMEFEAWAYDPIFMTQIPFAAQGVGNPGGAQPGPNGVNTPAANGRNGGRPSGPSKDSDGGDA